MFDSASGKYGYADETGAIVIEPRFERAGQFLEGLAPVQLRGGSYDPLYGYIDIAGTVVIEPRFTAAFAFSQGLARVKVVVKGLPRYGYIDRTGAWVIEPRFPYAESFVATGLAAVDLEELATAVGQETPVYAEDE